MESRPRPVRLPEDGYAARVVPLVVLILILGGIGVREFVRPGAVKIAAVPPPPPAPVEPEPEPEKIPPPQPKPVAAAPAPPPAPKLDAAAVARAAARVERARRDEAEAEAKLSGLSEAVARAESEAERDEAILFTLDARSREADARIKHAVAEGGRAAAERDKLAGEVAAIAKTAKPRPKALVDKSPVAKPIQGDEAHFEVRRGRVTPIELDKLVDLVKADARVRMRVGGALRGRPITATVGPAGSFSLKYEIGLMVGDAGDEPLGLANVAYGLRGWELVPNSDDRGETLEGVVQPGSDYANAVMKLRPGKTSVTFWVYPDGFPLYRRLRDDLHARGFLVAARPLPEGLSIQASPSGSLSAAQ